MSRSVRHTYSKVSAGDYISYHDPQRNYLAQIIEPVGKKYKIKILSTMQIITVRRRDFRRIYNYAVK